MAFNTVLQQGKFTSDGTAKTIQLRADVDWMEVYNFTNAGATGNDGCVFYWQRGMSADTGIYYFKSGGGNTLNLNALSSSGFTYYDPTVAEFGSATAITSSTDAAQPVFTVASTAALNTGDKLLIYGMSGQTSLNGYEFEIEVINGTTFKPRYALANGPGVAGTGGYYRVRQREPFFNPQRRLVVNVTSAANAVITFNRQHSYTAGDEVRLGFNGSAWGDFVDLDGTTATVVSAAASTITVDVDTTGLSAFAFPLPAAFPFTPAEVVPYGVTNATNTSDDTDNVQYIGMVLAGGASAPGGGSSDVIYWRAGKSFSVNNE